ncbi:hypothetical protein VTL71DRAFT_8803 [Oculimacula yallundae]|uniref:Alpha/beta-hydrolase n=1 Tax=Oculimacula yallundae TaxID=86028 RepID=A0ABR4D069_9HELO
MNFRSKVPEYEERPRYTRDQSGQRTGKYYLRALRWQVWVTLLIFLLWSAHTTQQITICNILGWKTPDLRQVKNEAPGWKWSEVMGKISSSDNVIWHRCYEDFDCARLEVPLDWLDPSDPRRATIAIIRYNATDRDNYKGPVFINPGGPGGSGVWFVKHLAPYYQLIVGRNHDIISFDPRGVGATTPQISCWDSSIARSSSRLWNLQEPPVLDAHPGIIYDSYAHAEAFSQHCLSQLGDTARFVSTPSVARDMLHIMEKLGEEKLKYWGFSYGTFLGVTFASLFPDKVGRMVNDGNVDARDYVSGIGTHFLQDTDKVMDSFYTFCHLAGPETCHFYSSSPEAIQTRVSTLLENIKKHPIIVPASSSHPRPEIISYSKLQRLITSALYRPLIMFPPLASVLSSLETGEGFPFLNLTSQGLDEQPLCENNSQGNPTDPKIPTPEVPEAEASADASKAIMCSDGAPVPDNVEDFEVYVEKLMGLSRSAGAVMVSLVMGCVGWKGRAKWQFTGPFEGNTSSPILFIANTADNVTPLRSAISNAAGFSGSVVMIQDSYGHTSLSCPSRCTARTIRAYFQNGTVPPNGTICSADLVPFDSWEMNPSSALSTDWTSESLTIGDESAQLDFALRELIRAPMIGV